MSKDLHFPYSHLLLRKQIALYSMWIMATIKLQYNEDPPCTNGRHPCTIPVKYTCGLFLYSHGILLFFFFRTLILFWETIYEFGSHLLSVFINAYNVSFKSSPRGETVIKPIIEMMAAPSYKINRHIFLKDINISVMIFTPVYCNPRNMHGGVRYYLLELSIHIPPPQSKNHISAGYAVEILILDRT